MEWSLDVQSSQVKQLPSSEASVLFHSSPEWFGLEETLKIMFPLPAVGKDATYWINFLRAPSYLPWLTFWAQNRLLPTILISKWPSCNDYWLSKLLIFINQAEVAAPNIGSHIAVTALLSMKAYLPVPGHGNKGRD